VSKARTERGGIINTVSSHGDDTSVLTQARDDFAFVIRKHFGLDVFDPELARDGFGGGLVVPGEHDDTDALIDQCSHGIGGCRLDGIGNREETADAAVDGHENDGCSFAAKTFGFFRKG
jgi:hypothetical protein